jgi:DNA-binding NarL/FixJ family response regulator
MGKHVGIYLQSPIIKKWFNESLRNLNEFIGCQHFPTLQVLLKYLQTKADQELANCIVLLEVEGELASEQVKQVLDYSRDIRVIGVGYPKDIENIKKLLTIGIRGYIDITFNDLDFLSAIRTVSDNRFYLPASKIDELINEFILESNFAKKEDLIIEKSSRSTLVTYSLSEKERSVVQYLLKGYSYKEIAELIGVSPFVVNQRTKSVYKKCGVKSRSELSYLLLK